MSEFHYIVTQAWGDYQVGAKLAEAPADDHAHRVVRVAGPIPEAAPVAEPVAAPVAPATETEH